MTHTLSVRYARYGLWLVRSFGLTFLLALLILGMKLANQPFIETQRVEARANFTSYNSIEATVKEAQLGAQKYTELQNLMDGFAQTHAGDFSVVITDNTNGEVVQHNQAQLMNSASLYKAFLVFYAYREIDAVRLHYSDAFLDGQNVEQCFEKVITVSDNPCGVELQRRYGSQATLYFQSQGLTDTDLTGEYPQTSAQDMATLLSHIHNGTDLSDQSAQNYQDLLSRQKITPRLPALLPNDATVMHKTGDLESVCHDAGIIQFADADYSLVVMTDNWKVAQSDKNQAVAQLSGQIFELMTAR